MPKVTIELPEIKGYEYTGEFRPPDHEYHAWGGDQAAYGTSSEPALILRKLKERRPVNGDDLMKLLKGGELTVQTHCGSQLKISRVYMLSCSCLNVGKGREFNEIEPHVLMLSTVEAE